MESPTLQPALGLVNRILKHPRPSSKNVPYGKAVKALSEVLEARINPLPDLEIDSFRSLLAETGIRVNREIMRRFLQINILRKWREGRLATCPDREFWNWVSVEGMDIIETLSRQKRGILVATSHFGPSHVVSLVLQRLGHPVYEVSTENFFRSTFGLSDEDFSGRFRVIEVSQDTSPNHMKTVNAVRRLLKEGAIVHAALDGRHGQGGLVVRFLGRRLRVRLTIPYAAAMADAAVVPVTASVGSAGKISVKILAPLPERAPDCELNDYAESIVKEYTRIFEAKWLADPGNITAEIPPRIQRAGRPRRGRPDGAGRPQFGSL